MNYIKTPVATIPVDEPAILITEEEFDKLPPEVQNTGTYYITDCKREGITTGDLLEIIGNHDISGIGDGTITGAILAIYNRININFE